MTYRLKSGNFARFSTFSALLIGLSLAACGAPKSESVDTAAASTGTLRVALLTPGPVSDQAWNGGAFAGLQRIKDSLAARVSHIQTKTPAEFDENFRLYGEQGYSIVFGHGFEYQDAAKRVAPDFPKTMYVTTSGNTTGPNIAGLEFAFEDGAYLAGIVAGAATRSGTIGVIGGQEMPPVKRSFYAFEAGAKSVNPTIRVITSYIGNWDDASAGKEQALAQIGRGVDVIFQNADAAGLGVFQAARESKGVRIIGANSDQNSIAPEVVLGSVVIDLPHAFLLVAKEVQAGTFAPRVISLGMKTDVVRLVINPALRTTIPASALTAVDSVTKQLVAGTFSAPVPPITAVAK
ncbi:MAG: BMP family protein [Gemmatimonadaceae bacterium]|nr:BMP family protein [Gemmatimonadaceae bacterium]